MKQTKDELIYNFNKYRMKFQDTKLTPQQVLNIYNVENPHLRESFLNIVQTANPKEVVFGNSEDEVTLTLNDYISGYANTFDVYDVLAGFNITHPAIQHAVKKILMCGQRGHKDTTDDLLEIISALSRS